VHLIPPRVNLDEGDLHFALLERFFEILQRLLFVAQTVIDHCEVVSRNVTFRGGCLQFFQGLFRLFAPGRSLEARGGYSTSIPRRVPPTIVASCLPPTPPLTRPTSMSIDQQSGQDLRERIRLPRGCDSLSIKGKRKPGKHELNSRLGRESGTGLLIYSRGLPCGFSTPGDFLLFLTRLMRQTYLDS